MHAVEALKQAIEEAGGLTALADLLKATPQTINNWRKRGVPAERCKDIELAVAGKVTCEQLRPDVFGKRAAA